MASTFTVALGETYRDFSSKKKTTHSFVHNHKTKSAFYYSLLTMMMPVGNQECGLAMHYGGQATANFTNFLMVRELVDRFHLVSKHRLADLEGGLSAYEVSISVSCRPFLFKANNYTASEMALRGLD